MEIMIQWIQKTIFLRTFSSQKNSVGDRFRFSAEIVVCNKLNIPYDDDDFKFLNLTNKQRNYVVTNTSEK